MAQQKAAPARGVIRHEQTGAARRVSAGSLIPDGWTFEGDGAEATRTAKDAAVKKAAKKPAETTKAEGPSDQG